MRSLIFTIAAIGSLVAAGHARGMDAVGGYGICGVGCAPCDQSGFTGGIEATFLHPNISSSNFSGAGIFVDNGGNFDGVFLDSDDFEYDYGTGPRLWLAYEGARCWGARVRYWEFHYLDSIHCDCAPSADSHAGLRNWVFDAELTRRFGSCACSVLASFGYRYASYDLSEQQFLDNGLLQTVESSFHRDGHSSGLIGGLEGRHRIGHSPLAFVWGLRGSVGWGDVFARSSAHAGQWQDGGGVFASASAEAFAGGRGVSEQANAQTIIVDGAIARSDADARASARSADDLYIFEMQLGLEYSRQLRCISRRLFVRTMFEYQHWKSHAAARAFTLAETELDGVSLVAVSGSRELSLDLIGFTAAIGCDW